MRYRETIIVCVLTALLVLTAPFVLPVFEAYGIRWNGSLLICGCSLLLVSFMCGLAAQRNTMAFLATISAVAMFGAGVCYGLTSSTDLLF
jgi:hypothetical protein